MGGSPKERVATEENPAQRFGAVEQRAVFKPSSPILLGGQNVHAAQPETLGDGQGYVHVHVEADAQRSRPRAFSRLTSSESAAGCCSNST